MFAHDGNVLKELEIENCGHTNLDFFCYYRYKDECEPEINKTKYPNPEDRWYEDYMTLDTITNAKLSGLYINIEKVKDRIEWSNEFRKYVLKRK